MRKLLVAVLTLLLVLAGCATKPAAVTDPLSSWNDTAARRNIVDFVQRVTAQGGPDFVPETERIAVFDNDGTLWPENPMPFELAFAVDAVKKHAAEDPQLAADPLVAQAKVNVDTAQVNLGYALSFLLAGAGMAALYQTHGNLQGVSLSLSSVRSVHAGDVVRLSVNLSNPHRRRGRYGLQVWIGEPALPGFADLPPEAAQFLKGELPWT